MNGILRIWMIRAGSRLPELTAAMFLLIGLLAAGWIVAGNSKSDLRNGKPAVVKPAAARGSMQFAGDM